MSDESPSVLPHPVLTGPDGERLRRFREKAASGAIVPPILEGERGVSFLLEPKDLTAFQYYKSRSQPLSYYRTSLIIVALIVATVVLIKIFGPLSSPASRPAIPQNGTNFLMNFLISLLLPFLVFVAFWFLFLRQAMFGKASKNAFEPTTLSITPEYLIGRGADDEAKTRWKAVEDVRIYPEHIVFFLKNAAGHMIPRYAFQDAADRESFFAEAQSYWRREKEAGRATPDGTNK